MPNVIIFGDTGVGKSSVINMLHGGDIAKVSDGTTGTTFDNQSYMKEIGGKYFKVFDTIGLNEGSHGTVKPKDAIEQLWKLINALADGVHLLVFVMRAPRITQTCEQNYKLFFEIFCEKKAPIAIIITGL
jgi:predicted GTPase